MAQPTGTATDSDARPLLDLRTIEKVEFIDIDGERHDLINLDALPLRERSRISELFMSCMELIVRDGAAVNDPKSKPLTRKQERELSGQVKALLPLLVPALKAETIGALNEAQRQEIVLAFFVLRIESAERSSAMERMATVVNAMLTRPSIGANTSRGSNGSTAATSRRGTKSSRRGS